MPLLKGCRPLVQILFHITSSFYSVHILLCFIWILTENVLSVIHVLCSWANAGAIVVGESSTLLPCEPNPLSQPWTVAMGRLTDGEYLWVWRCIMYSYTSGHHCVIMVITRSHSLNVLILLTIVCGYIYICCWWVQFETTINGSRTCVKTYNLLLVRSRMLRSNFYTRSSWGAIYSFPVTHSRLPLLPPAVLPLTLFVMVSFHMSCCVFYPC